jgi:hypothetical protein
MRASYCFAAAALALVIAPAAQATVFAYAGKLKGSNEVPATGSTATGWAQVWYNSATHKLEVHVTFSGLIGTSTASHVHVRTGSPPGPTGGVATELPAFTGFPLGVHDGTYAHLFDQTAASSWNPSFVAANGGTTAGAEAAFAAALADGRAYLNVHSSMNPGGEIRANLTVIPEPASWVLLIGGFGLAGTALRRRRTAVRFA